MYCTNCGKPNDDGAVYCTDCGAPLSGGAPSSPETASSGYTDYGAAYSDDGLIDDGTGKKNRLMPIIVGAAAAIGLAILLICLLSGRSWKGTLKSVMRSVKKLDMVSIIDILPKAVIDYQLEGSDITMSELKDQLKESREELVEELEEELDNEYDMSLRQFMNGISYKVKKVEDFSKKELRKINEDFEDDYDTKSNYVKAGKHVKLKLSMELDGDTQSDNVEIDLIKVGNKWYVSPYCFFDASDLLYYLW